MTTNRFGFVLIAVAVCASTACGEPNPGKGNVEPPSPQAALPGLPRSTRSRRRFRRPSKGIAGAFMDLGTAFSKAKDAWAVTKFLLQLLEILPKDNPDAKLDALRDEVAKATMGISWQSTLLFIDTQRGGCVDAVNALIREHGQLAEGSSHDANCGSAAAALAGTSPFLPPKVSGAFLRPFSELVTDGLWKQVVSDRPQVQAGTLVYDWRLGAPALMEAPTPSAHKTPSAARAAGTASAWRR
jgi:hypothetical protein